MRVLTLTFVAALVLLATYRMAGQPTFFCEDQDGSTWNSGPEGYGCGEVVQAKVPTRKQFNPVAWDAWLAGLSESKNIADWRTSEEKALDNEHWLNPIPAPPSEWLGPSEWRHVEEWQPVGWKEGKGDRWKGLMEKKR
jgi:hypothetical protein